MSISSLVKSNGNKALPPEFCNGQEFLDAVFIHALGIINGKLISGHALVDVTRPAHARNIGDARERCAVNSHRGSTMKWDGAPTT
jgi:hypothetical protein